MPDAMTSDDVPESLAAVAEQALDVHLHRQDIPEPSLREAVKIMLAAVLPMYGRQLGAQLGKLTIPCLRHSPSHCRSDCVYCQRYTALLGARRIIEGRDDAAEHAARLQRDTGR